MSYKVTGRKSDPNKVTLIVEEVTHPEPKIKTLKEIVGNRKQQPKGGQEQKDSHRLFFLVHQATGVRYADAGQTVYFQSKQAAKKIRNTLNSRMGSGTYNIVRVNEQELRWQTEMSLYGSFMD